MTMRPSPRRLEPVGTEERELLALRLGGADREAAGAEPEGLALGERLEVARPGEDEEGGEHGGIVDSRQRAESGELERRIGGRGRHAAEGEERRIVGDLAGFVAVDHEDLDRHVEDEARMHELHGESGRRIGEEASVVGVADAGVVGGGEVDERFRQRRLRRGERRGGELAGTLEDDRSVEPFVLRRGAAARRPGGQRQRCGAGEEMATRDHARAAAACRPRHRRRTTEHQRSRCSDSVTNAPDPTARIQYMPLSPARVARTRAGERRRDLAGGTRSGAAFGRRRPRRPCLRRLAALRRPAAAIERTWPIRGNPDIATWFRASGGHARGGGPPAAGGVSVGPISAGRPGGG